MVLERKIVADFREDNQAMIHVANTGRNPTMKPLNQVQRVSVGWIHERLNDGLFIIIYEETDKMAADIYTKGFTDAVKWHELLLLITFYNVKTRKP